MNILKCILLISIFKLGYPEAPSRMVPDHDDEGNLEIKELINYAALTAGASVVAKSDHSNGYSNVLLDDIDKYMMSPCKEKKWLVIGLSEHIAVKSFVVSNYEKYSSYLTEFQVLSSVSYPVKEWLDLGIFVAEPKLGDQIFNLTTPAGARYLKFKFNSHLGTEFYCTISQIKVHGTTIVEQINEAVDRSDEELRNMHSFLDTDRADSESPTDDVKNITSDLDLMNQNKTLSEEPANDGKNGVDVSNLSFGTAEVNAQAGDHKNGSDNVKLGSPSDIGVSTSTPLIGLPAEVVPNVVSNQNTIVGIDMRESSGNSLLSSETVLEVPASEFAHVRDSETKFDVSNQVNASSPLIAHDLNSGEDIRVLDANAIGNVNVRDNILNKIDVNKVTNVEIASSAAGEPSVSDRLSGKTDNNDENGLKSPPCTPGVWSTECTRAINVDMPKDIIVVADTFTPPTCISLSDLPSKPCSVTGSKADTESTSLPAVGEESTVLITVISDGNELPAISPRLTGTKIGETVQQPEDGQSGQSGTSRTKLASEPSSDVQAINHLVDLDTRTAAPNVMDSLAHASNRMNPDSPEALTLGVSSPDNSTSGSKTEIDGGVEYAGGVNSDIMKNTMPKNSSEMESVANDTVLVSLVSPEPNSAPSVQSVITAVTDLISPLIKVVKKSTDSSAVDDSTDYNAPEEDKSIKLMNQNRQMTNLVEPNDIESISICKESDKMSGSVCVPRGCTVKNTGKPMMKSSSEGVKPFKELSDTEIMRECYGAFVKQVPNNSVIENSDSDSPSQTVGNTPTESDISKVQTSQMNVEMNSSSSISIKEKLSDTLTDIEVSKNDIKLEEDSDNHKTLVSEVSRTYDKNASEALEYNNVNQVNDSLISEVEVLVNASTTACSGVNISSLPSVVDLKTDSVLGDNGPVINDRLSQAGDEGKRCVINDSPPAGSCSRAVSGDSTTADVQSNTDMAFGSPGQSLSEDTDKSGATKNSSVVDAIQSEEVFVQRKNISSGAPATENAVDETGMTEAFSLRECQGNSNASNEPATMKALAATGDNEWSTINDEASSEFASPIVTFPNTNSTKADEEKVVQLLDPKLSPLSFPDSLSVDKFLQVPPVLEAVLAEKLTLNFKTRECFEALKFSEFQATMRARLQKASEAEKGKSDPFLLLAQDKGILKLVQKVKDLEINYAIIEKYTAQVSDCYRSVLNDFVAAGNASAMALALMVNMRGGMKLDIPIGLSQVGNVSSVDSITDTLSGGANASLRADAEFGVEQGLNDHLVEHNYGDDYDLVDLNDTNMHCSGEGVLKTDEEPLTSKRCRKSAMRRMDERFDAKAKGHSSIFSRCMKLLGLDQAYYYEVLLLFSWAISLISFSFSLGICVWIVPKVLKLENLSKE